MISTSYKVYISDIINLTKSFVIKSQHTINASNSFLSLAGDELSVDYIDWKYYKNISGQYYTGSSGDNDDLLMSVISIDSKLSIPFTITDLTLDPLTYNEYRLKGKFYNTLVSLYPDQQMLIDGILNPVDIDTAYNANNYTILYYDDTCTDSNEYSLMSDLQRHVYDYGHRWDIESYAVSDSMYPAGFIAVMFLDIVVTIINLRLERCKTDEVHTFHLWNYLSGYLTLGDYRNKIPHGQALFLYRNIDYIIAHAGEHDVLVFLNDYFADPYGLDLYEYNILQNSSFKLSQLIAENYNSLNNEIEFNRNRYNNVDKENTIVTTSTALRLLQPIALENPDGLDNTIIDTDELHQVSSSVKTPTGIIECNVSKDVSDSLVNRTIELIHNWFYLALTDKYLYQFNLVIPELNIVDVRLTAKQAVAVLLYSAARYQGVVLTNIPTRVLVRGIFLDTLPSESDIKSTITEQYLKGSIIYGSGNTVEWDRYTDVIDDIPVLAIQTTLSGFEEYVNTVLTKKVRNKYLVGLEPNSEGKIQILSMIDKTMVSADYQVSDLTTYAELFTELEFDPSAYTDAEFELIILNILDNVIGTSENSVTLTSPHREMKEILDMLTSYTLQLVGGATVSDTIPMEWCFNDSISPSSEIDPPWYRAYFGTDMDENKPILIDIGDISIDNTLEPMLSSPTIDTDYCISEGLDVADTTDVYDYCIVANNGLQPFVADVIITE